MVMIQTFFRVSVCGLYFKNQYNSSSSTVPEQSLAIWPFRSILALFFYPTHHIGFVHLQNLSCSAPADPAVIHFYCELADFFRLLMLLRINGVVDAALLTFTALTSRCIITCFDLVLRFPTFRAFFPCLFCYLFHISYSITKSLFWTLPVVGGGQRVLKKGKRSLDRWPDA